MLVSFCLAAPGQKNDLSVRELKTEYKSNADATHLHIWELSRIQAS